MVKRQFSLMEIISPEKQVKFIKTKHPTSPTINFAIIYLFLIDSFNPVYAGSVIACPDSYREGLKLQENQTVWRLRHSTAMVKSKTAAKQLILKQFQTAIDRLMHIPGLTFTAHSLSTRKTVKMDYYSLKPS
ncbi:hypothetical protein [Echinicola strongylocentroti]|uniref:hypothetical protein n=1 Tax=Echinicola strongylocentroti TaxID=1795355 RepID=UPI0013A6A088|nr:hypothetical protein [Echinicola strongylocentroti]